MSDWYLMWKYFQVLNVRLPEDRGRLRGFGYVEFADRQNLLDALSMNEEVYTMYWSISCR